MNANYHFRNGATAAGPYRTVITPESAGWDYSGLRVLELAPGGTERVETGEDELLVLPLAGSCSVTCDGESVTLAGRTGVFARPTDFAYVPRDAAAVVSSDRGGLFALPGSRCARRLPFRYQPAEATQPELRGAGNCSRQVNNYCLPHTFDADRLLVCEVLTPSGNWSSYPPHKHDEQRDGETQLEEIYYFEVAGGPGGEGMAYQRVYSSAAGDIDVCAEVVSGDVVLIPHGWHGPSMAVPGYDLYYLNVMAGPGPERAWRICDDPAHGWIRQHWQEQEIDPRLPFGTGSHEGRGS
ncbi:5-deoxy-glucuronate isomerase [Haloechinothrix sp. LS1_15]|uniref:5-deoxy-glucuronate isomerase n=1 Tax=Haloechinothrix sp. LS1_15 TaxID=2652248 RepID=UPI00294594CE|nr:5-deoxy-glucuronate isomerase [Haloechinothrix sp. LS1_15]MDV6012591.1 5-deoxy-glucuronate isomerase [Haloechinothrix sp. LS1_15]